MEGLSLLETTEDITRFASVDKQKDPGFFIDFVDAGNALEDIRSVKRVMLSHLELTAGMAVLDVGCGAGDDARQIAQIVGAYGSVVGVDSSGAMIAEARRRNQSSRLPLEFFEGNAQELPFPDGSFDRARTERMLMHLDRPEQGLAEMVRVVRSGGRVVAFDFDGDTVFADSPDRATTRKIARSWSDGIRHSWIGRSLPRLFHDAGLTGIVSVPHAVRVPYAFSHRLFDGHLANAVEAGAVPAADLAQWWHHLAQADAAGRFHLGFLGFIVSGRKP